MMKLKRCPFCGGTEKEEYLKVVDVAPPNLGYHYAVYCDNCGSMGAATSTRWKAANPIDKDKNTAKREAIQSWNTRTHPPVEEDITIRKSKTCRATQFPDCERDFDTYDGSDLISSRGTK